MTTTISSTDLVMLQGTNASTRTGTAQGGNATTPATTQTAPPATKQDIQAAARDFSEAIRNNVQARVNAAQIEQAVAQGVAGGVQGAEPAIAGTPPDASRTFTIRGSNGTTQTITIPPGAFDNEIPPQAVDISIVFFLMIAAIIIGLPLVRAFARRMDRRGTAQIPNEISSQLAHLNQAVDAIALEVERISEGQRFTTRLLSEQKEAGRQPLSSGAGR
jgi:hypothetical protein